MSTARLIAPFRPTDWTPDQLSLLAADVGRTPLDGLDVGRWPTVQEVDDALTALTPLVARVDRDEYELSALFGAIDEELFEQLHVSFESAIATLVSFSNPRSTWINLAFAKLIAARCGPMVSWDDAGQLSLITATTDVDLELHRLARDWAATHPRGPRWRPGPPDDRTRALFDDALRGT